MTLDDDDIDDIVTQAPCLTSIDLSNTKVTGAGVKLLVDKIPTLESLTLDDCTRISSRDIVRYAESKGVRVSMKMAQVSGGRKVRYG
jgi:F-box/TPR repeat protein Pof3